MKEKGRSGKREEGEEKVVGKVYAIDGDEDGGGEELEEGGSCSMELRGIDALGRFCTDPL